MLVKVNALHFQVKAFDLFALLIDSLLKHELYVFENKDVGLLEGV